MTEDNNAVVGEETIDTSAVEVKEIPLIKPAVYPVTFKGASVHCGKAWNSVPNINLMHKLKDGNRVAFSTLLLGNHPDKNGQLNIQRKNGLKAFLSVLGTNIEKLRVLSREAVNPDTNEKTILKYCDSEQIMKVLEQYYGAEYRVRIQIKPAQNNFPAKNDVFEFFPAE